jgi:hypothetical protein
MYSKCSYLYTDIWIELHEHLKRLSHFLCPRVNKWRTLLNPYTDIVYALMIISLLFVSLNRAYIVVCTFCIQNNLFQTIKFCLCHVEHPPICCLQYKLIVKICKLSALHISVLASCPASRTTMYARFRNNIMEGCTMIIQIE